MALKDYMKDIATYAIGIGFFDKLGISAAENELTLEAMDKNKDVILLAKFDKPNTELLGEFGMANLSLLQTITSDSEFNDPDSNIELVYETKNAEKIPSELVYKNKSKSYINYRLMNKSLVPKVPPFNEPKWDVKVAPTKNSIQQFAWAANGLSAYEQYFIPKIVDGELKLFIGEESAATQRGGVVLAENRSEKFETQHMFKIQHVLPVLKSTDTCDCVMNFSAKAIMVELNTGVAKYKYIFPAKMR